MEYILDLCKPTITNHIHDLISSGYHTITIQTKYYGYKFIVEIDVLSRFCYVEMFNIDILMSNFNTNKMEMVTTKMIKQIDINPVIWDDDVKMMKPHIRLEHI